MSDQIKFMILDNMPIVSEQEGHDIQNPDMEITLNILANSQILRYPGDHPLSGRLVLDVNGKVQYRRTEFSKEPQPNVDLRKPDRSYTYVTEEIEAEINLQPFIIKDQQLGSFK
tara:strand:+ start:9909 stop:10250 length:342 start_codon:yes stop_codon:yes gene_type:complete